MLKWAKTEENLALQDVFSKVFEVSSMWTTLWKDFGEEVLVYCFIIFWNCRETRFDHQPALLLRKDDLMGGFATHMPSRFVYWLLEEQDQTRETKGNIELSAKWDEILIPVLKQWIAKDILLLMGANQIVQKLLIIHLLGKY